MATCEHTDYVCLPPGFQWLIKTFPYIRANKELDRTIPRCRLCDLIAAQKRAEEAEFSPPAHTNPIDAIEKEIKELGVLIEQDIKKEESEATLAKLRKIRENAIFAMDKRIENAWGEHWEIWGPGHEGPARMERFDDELDWETPEGKETVPVSEAVGTPENKAKQVELESPIDFAINADLNVPSAEETTITELNRGRARTRSSTKASRENKRKGK